MGYQGGRRYGRSDYRDPRDDYENRTRAGREDRGRYGGYAGRRGPPAGYDYEDRGFFDRAGDEVRSWFGDEEAERRREYDEYYNRPYGDPRDQSSRMGFVSSGPGGYRADRGYAPFTGERSGYGNTDHGRAAYGQREHYGQHHDSNYQAWRDERIGELDRDYAEYQRENRQRFESEFGQWRQRRTTQRSALGQVEEHMEVVGRDGEHVGTVDKVAGDRIILTKNDKDAGGIHHSIPSRWIDSVSGKTVTIDKSAAEAKDEWRVERERQALFGDNDQPRQADDTTWSYRAYTFYR